MCEVSLSEWWAEAIKMKRQICIKNVGFEIDYLMRPVKTMNEKELKINFLEHF